MDVHAFGQFLTSLLKKHLDPLENNILNANYDDIKALHRAAGARDVLSQIIDNMEGFISDFYKLREKDSGNTVIANEG